MKNNDLTLESCKSVPSLHVTFLDTGVIFTEFRNNSEKIIEIHEASCQFTSEDGLRPTKFTNCKPAYLEPKNSHSIRIDVKFGLELKMGTNAYAISVKFKAGLSRMKKQNFIQHEMNLIIHPKRALHDEFIESHKNPEDATITKKLKLYLEKCGFKGFVAEEELLPGIKLWEDKIYPAIDQCKALIVIWTKSSQTDPESIEREIIYAKKKNKPIIPIIEGELTLPEIISSEKEYFQYEKITDESLIEIVTAINRTYELGKYED